MNILNGDDVTVRLTVSRVKDNGEICLKYSKTTRGLTVRDPSGCVTLVERPIKVGSLVKATNVDDLGYGAYCRVLYIWNRKFALIVPTPPSGQPGQVAARPYLALLSDLSPYFD